MHGNDIFTIKELDSAYRSFDVYNADGSIIKYTLVFIISATYSPYFQYVQEIPSHAPENTIPLTDVLADHYELIYAFDVDGVGNQSEQGWYCRKKFSFDMKHIFVPYPGEDITPEEFEQLLEIMEL